jgi:hypothetical protein
MSGSNDDDVRQGSAARRGERAVGSAVGPVNLCPATDVFAAGCNSPCRRQEFDADERRRRDDVIEAFSTDRADQPLRMPILPGRPRRRWVITNAHSCKAPGDGMTVGRIAVTDLPQIVHQGDAFQMSTLRPLLPFTGPMANWRRSPRSIRLDALVRLT